MKYIVVFLMVVTIFVYSFISPSADKEWDAIVIGASASDPYLMKKWGECYVDGKVKDGTNMKWSDYNTWKINRNISIIEFEFDSKWVITYVKTKTVRRSGIFWLSEVVINMVL